MGRPKLKIPEKYCENCGKKLERRSLPNGCEESLYWFNRRRFCSVLCANQKIAAERLKQPALSPKQSRVRARNSIQNAPCFICGKVGYTEVHHIDKNPMNNDPSNLVRLCKSCHAKQHRMKSSCVVCGLPVKGHNLCNKHWQAWRKSIKRGFDTEYTAMIKEKLNQMNLDNTNS